MGLAGASSSPRGSAGRTSAWSGGPPGGARVWGGSGRAGGLGGPGERVFRGDAGSVGGMGWDGPNVVIVMDEERATKKGWISAGYESAGRWALPEDEFEHRSGMITKGPTRALGLPPLRPRPGDSALG